MADYDPIEDRLALWQVPTGMTPTQKGIAAVSIGAGAFGVFQLIRGRIAWGVPLLAVGAGAMWWIYSKKAQAEERADALREYAAAEIARGAEATATGWEIGARAAGKRVVGQSLLDADRQQAEAEIAG